MKIILYFLLGLGIATGHSDHGVSYRAQNFEETLQNIDKEVYLNHQREKRFVAGHNASHNLVNRPTWLNFNTTRSNTTLSRPPHHNRGHVLNVTRMIHNGTRNQYGRVQVNYPGQTGYAVPSNTIGYVNPGTYNSSVSRPAAYPNNYNNINVIPVNTNTANSSGYRVNPVTPAYMPYPGYPGYPAPKSNYTAPNPGLSASNSSYPAQNSVYPAPTVYPGPNNVSPAPNTVYPVPNNIYPAPGTVKPAPNTVYPVPNHVYPAPANVYPAPGTVYPASNSSFPAPNNVYPAPGTVYPAPNNVYPAPGTVNPAPNIVYPGPNNVYPAPGTVYPAPNTVHPATASNSSYPAPNNVYPKPGTVYPAPNNTFPFHPPANINGVNNTTSSPSCTRVCNLPRANSTITKEERTMDACVIICNDCPEGMKRTAMGMCVKDEDYDY